LETQRGKIWGRRRIIGHIILWNCRNLGLATKTRGYKVVGQRGDSGVTSHVPKSAKNVKESTLSLPSEFSWWQLESQMDFRNFIEWFLGQNSMACGFFYIIGKLLERKCVKWACIAHLNIWNTSYGQKNGRKSNWQFDCWPQKVKNWPDLLIYRRCATYCWKLLTKATTFLQIASRSEVCSQNYEAPKSREFQLGWFWDSQLGVLRQKAIWMWAPWPVTEYIIRGKVVVSPKSKPWWILCVCVARGSS
jgi:hypothetical protein